MAETADAEYIWTRGCAERREFEEFEILFAVVAGPQCAFEQAGDGTAECGRGTG